MTVCDEMIFTGAEYTPVELIVPNPAGLIVHITAWVAPFVTVAVNRWLWLAFSVKLDGLTVTDTVGRSVTVAVAVLLGLIWLVAVTGTVWTEPMLTGAV